MSYGTFLYFFKHTSVYGIFRITLNKLTTEVFFPHH